MKNRNPPTERELNAWTFLVILVFATMLLMMLEDCTCHRDAQNAAESTQRVLTPPESLYKPRVAPAPAERPYNLLDDYANPANPLSPLSPLNPASPLYQPTPSWNGGF